MRLIKLQISGFKSFVDPTEIRLPANWVAVVGPNGCGKSNIIDAVRWVMGEASARNLRGDQMVDVIFNGSTTRKPVGKASVELVFDNSDGAIGGNFSKFAEISVQRTLSRDGQSNYYINRIKTRRKDVLDLFRGTGLGPRSYSIIEQGMVSRIIEARSEDLRLFVEEAAGTSRYKDRRRETETRIKNTRENLERVDDLRDELGRQLRRLKRQAGAAKRYRELKAEQRLVNGQLLLLRLTELEDDMQQHDRQSAQHENNLQSAIAKVRENEAKGETLRREQNELHETHGKIDRRFYDLTAQITNTEQRIEHLTETQQQRDEQIDRLQDSCEQHQQQLDADSARLNKLQSERAQLAGELEAVGERRTRADAQLAEAEQSLDEWRSAWETFNQQLQTPARERDVQQSRIVQLEQHLKRTTDHAAKLKDERDALQTTVAEMNIDAVRADVRKHDDSCEQNERELRGFEEQLQTLEQTIQQERDRAAQLRERDREIESRGESLRQIQTAALGGDDEALREWLSRHQLSDAPRLAARVRVADGWQRAADRLLNGHLGALCIAQHPQAALRARPDCAFSLLVERPVKGADDNNKRARLLDKVESGAADLTALLGGVYLAETLDDAIAMQGDLRGRECAVTRDGELVGANWISFASQSQMETGVLVREEEIHQLQQQLAQLQSELAERQTQTEQLESERSDLRERAKRQRNTNQKLRADNTAKHGDLGRIEARHLETTQRIAAIEKELASLGEHQQTDHGEIAKARELLKDATSRQSTLEAKRELLLADKAQSEQRVERCKTESTSANEHAHGLALTQQRLDAEGESLEFSVERLKRQLRDDGAQLQQLRGGVRESDSVDEIKRQLQAMLTRKADAEQELAQSQQAVGAIDNRIDESVSCQNQLQKSVGELRDARQQHELERQETSVRLQTQLEEFDRHGYERKALAEQLPDDADADKWVARSEQLTQQIDRIGPVNLVAIEEFDEESERKQHLDKQREDLTEALDTLVGVIQKIDRETRTLFQDTFERLNKGFGEFFPRLFGGGKASLQLTGKDLLSAGVEVMAQPPGKRNSTIHLLSGGEKALTAVALLFALFQLNPAPFCMLDEVDAPLDDANVARYCETIKTLVKVSQMIVITHNKITMESSEVLLGVTMGEAGVSRLVSVDIDEAVRLAAS